MTRHEAMHRLIEVALRAGETLASTLPDEQKNQTGTWETWAPKEAIGHVTTWISHDLNKLDGADRVFESVDMEKIDDINQGIFDESAAKTWDEIYGDYTSALNRCQTAIAGLSEDDLERERKYSDGTTSPIWKNLGFHLAGHLSSHLSLVLRRADRSDLAGSLDKEVAEVALELDDGDEWQGTIRYNLACSFALAGDAAQAIPLLRRAFEQRPGLVDRSHKDTDLDPIRQSDGFAGLYQK